MFLSLLVKKTVQLVEHSSNFDETSVETLLWSCSLPGGQSAGQAALHQAAPPSDVARQKAEAGPVLPTATLRTGRWEGEPLPAPGVSVRVGGICVLQRKVKRHCDGCMRTWSRSLNKCAAKRKFDSHWLVLFLMLLHSKRPSVMLSCMSHCINQTSSGLLLWRPCDALRESYVSRHEQTCWSYKLYLVLCYSCCFTET